MLVRLYGKNFRSLKAPFELSMVAAALTSEGDRDRGVVKVRLGGMDEPLRLLRSVAIFGANASGKSTVLTAGRALCWLATESSSTAKPGAGIRPYEPFLLSEQSRQAPIELGCDVVFKKTLLRYEISYRSKEIVRESLSLFGESGEQKLLERKSTGEVHGELIVQSDANRLYVKEMQPNIAVLSKLAQHGPHKGKESVRPYYQAIRSALGFADYSAATGMFIAMAGTDEERFAKDELYRSWIMEHLISASDVGICDVQTRHENLDIPSEVREQFAKTNASFRLPDKRLVVSFVHEGDSRTPIDFSLESAGTRKLFNVADEWWGLAHDNVCLFADELGASLHPRLVDRLIRAVNEPGKSASRSQLVFTTHDTGLLESQDGRPPALRRDQVYFTRKDGKGASELYSLTEFKDDARSVHNIRKRYLSGLYGAIPSVEGVSL